MPRPAVLVLMTWMLLGIWSSRQADRPTGGTAPPLAPPAFAGELAAWQVAPGPIPCPLGGANVTLADHRWSGRLDGPGGASADLHVWYCGSRRPRTRRMIWPHLFMCPLNLHPELLADTPVLPGSGLPVRRLRWYQEGRERQALLWLQSPGRTSTTTFRHLLWLYREDLAGRRSDGCFVLLLPAAPEIQAGDTGRFLELAGGIHASLTRWLDS